MVLRRLITSALAFSVLLVVPSAQGSLVIGYNLVDLAQRADDVVVGEVIAQETESINGMIITRSTLRVAHNIGGTTRVLEALEVVSPGGEYGGVGVDVEGAPELTINRRYLCFLQRRGNATTVVGLAQGALPIVEDEEGNDLVLPPAELPHLVRRIDGRFVATSPALIAPRPLADVIAVVQEARHGL